MARSNIIRRSSAVAVRARSDRKTLWLGSTVQSATLVAGTPQIFFSLNAAALAIRPFTIIRTYIEINWRTDQAAVSETQFGAVAAAVVSDQAVAIGATAVPTPVTDSGSSLFFAYQYMINFFEFGSGIGFDSQGGRRYVIDSKAMRKVEGGQDMIVVVENDSNGSGAIAAAFVRQLIKTH